MSIFKGKEYRLPMPEDNNDEVVTYITDDDPNGVVLFSGDKFYSDSCVCARIIDGIWVHMDLSGNLCLYEINNPDILKDIQEMYDKADGDKSKAEALLYAIADFILNPDVEYSTNDIEFDNPGTQVFSCKDIKIIYHKIDRKDYCILELQQEGTETLCLTCCDYCYEIGDTAIDNPEYLIDILVSSIC